MLKEQIEELKFRATELVRQIDKMCEQLHISIVKIEEGKLIFIDTESGLTVSAALITKSEADAIVDSVPGSSTVGEPGIKFN